MGRKNESRVEPVSRSDQPETKSLEQSQSITNQLVVLTSRLQKWSAAQTPLENEYQITFTQVSALYAIRYGANTPGAVAARMEITPRAATSHVDVLEAKGLLTRSIDPADRRRTILTLTEAGEQLSEDIEATALTSLRDYIHQLDDSEYRTIQTTIDVIRRFLQQIGALHDVEAG